MDQQKKKMRERDGKKSNLKNEVTGLRTHIYKIILLS